MYIARKQDIAYRILLIGYLVLIRYLVYRKQDIC